MRTMILTVCLFLGVNAYAEPPTWSCNGCADFDTTQGQHDLARMVHNIIWSGAIDPFGAPEESLIYRRDYGTGQDVIVDSYSDMGGRTMVFEFSNPTTLQSARVELYLNVGVLSLIDLGLIKEVTLQITVDGVVVPEVTIAIQKGDFYTIAAHIWNTVRYRTQGLIQQSVLTELIAGVTAIPSVWSTHYESGPNTGEPIVTVGPDHSFINGSWSPALSIYSAGNCASCGENQNPL